MNVYKLLIVAVIVLLVGCDNLDKKKVARKNFDPSKDLSLSDHLSAADSMAVFSCLMKDTSQLIETAFNVIAEPVFESRLKRDFDELTDALTIKDEKECNSCIAFDKQWVSYHVELYRNGLPIDSIRIYALCSKPGYRKNNHIYHFADSLKVRNFFESRHIQRMPYQCKADLRPQPGDCGFSCRYALLKEIQVLDIEGNALPGILVTHFADSLKKEALKSYVRYSASHNQHMNVDAVFEMSFGSSFMSPQELSSQRFQTTPEVMEMTHDIYDFIFSCDQNNCFGFERGKIKSVTIKMALRDENSKATSSPLAHNIAQADSMAVISCYPETPTPLLPPKKNETFNSISSSSEHFAPVPLKDDPRLKRKRRSHPKLTSYVAYTSNKQNDLEMFADAVVFNESEYCEGICFDKQWSSYYVELYKNGKFIDGTHFFTGPAKGYNKDGFNYYFANVAKVHEFFNTRNVFPMPRGCHADGNRHLEFKREKSKKRIKL